MNRNIIIALVAVIILVVGAFVLTSSDDIEEGTANNAESSESQTGSDNSSEGALEITYSGETRTFNDASCSASGGIGPADNSEMIRYRNADENIEFWVELDDPEQSDIVEVYLGLPTGEAGETIGEVEAYQSDITTAEVTFEDGVGTSGSAVLEPHNDMNDDVEHQSEGLDVSWDLSCV